MPEAPTNFIFDYLSHFENGADSGTHPLLLKPGTLAFLTNGTVRGGFISPRPPINKLTLDFGGDAVLQEAFESGLFQGATKYAFMPNTGTPHHVISIDGHIYKIEPVADRWVVTDISIPGDEGDPSVTQVWMWQSEYWLIINDGLKLPLFWDGAVMRRSDGPTQSVGTTAADWTIPPIGSQVTITLTAPYTWSFDRPIFIDGYYYQPIENPAGYNVELETLYDASGSPTVAAGEEVFANPTNIGYLENSINVPTGGSIPPNGFITNAKLSTDFTGSVGDRLLINGKVWKVYSIQNNAAVTIQITNDYTITSPGFSAPAGTLVTYASSQGPNTLLGTVTTLFPTPPTGGTIQIVLSQAYSGPADQIVYIGNRQFTINTVPPVAPGTSLTVINLTDPNYGATATMPNQRGPSYSVLAAPDEFKGPGDLFSVPELPAGRMGAYGHGHVAMSQVDGVSFIYGDVVGGPSGTPQFNYRDSVLKVSENTFLTGRGAFRIPSNGDTITAMWFIAQLDMSLGQGPLQVGTQDRIFSCVVPADRSLWIALEQPILTESLIGNGPQGQNSTNLVNSDTFFSSNPGLGSLIMARREFQSEWGNTTISEEMKRVVERDNKALLAYSTSIEFDNRYLQSVSPNANSQGVFHAGAIIINFDLVSNLRGKAPPAYDGLWTGINVLQYSLGRFANLQRAFAWTLNVSLQTIEFYEIMPQGDAHFDNGTIPIPLAFETACMFRDDVKPFNQMCKLMNGELYVRNVIGRVDFQVQWRPDFYPCWVPWKSFSICAETGTGNQKPGYRTRLGLGEPPTVSCEEANNRPLRIGHVHQFRIVYTGQCEFMGARFAAVPVPHTDFPPPECKPVCVWNNEQTFTANCPAGSAGNAVTKVIPFHTISAGTQEEADALALAMATEQAEAQIVCTECPTLTIADQQITIDDEDWSDPAPGYKIVKIPFSAAAGQHVNIIMDALSSPGPSIQCFILDSGGTNVLFHQYFINRNSFMGFDVPATGNYFLAFADAVANLPRTFSAHTDCTTNHDVPCALPGGLDVLDWTLVDYTDGDIAVGTCTPELSGQPAWDGSFLDFSNGGDGLWDADGTNFPSLFSIGGQLLGEADIFYRQCSALGDMSQTYWEIQIYLGNAFEEMWIGRKYIGNTPAGVYTRIRGCSPGPVNLTVNQL